MLKTTHIFRITIRSEWVHGHKIFWELKKTLDYFLLVFMDTQQNSVDYKSLGRSQWPRGLERRSVAAHLLSLRVRIPPGQRCLSWVLCVLSGRDMCDELITRQEEYYRLWCVVVCDLETSWMRRIWPTGGCRTKNKQTNILKTIFSVILCSWKKKISGCTNICQLIISVQCIYWRTKYIMCFTVLFR